MPFFYIVVCAVTSVWPFGYLFWIPFGFIPVKVFAMAHKDASVSIRSGSSSQAHEPTEQIENVSSHFSESRPSRSTRRFERQPSPFRDNRHGDDRRQKRRSRRDRSRSRERARRDSRHGRYTPPLGRQPSWLSPERSPFCSPARRPSSPSYHHAPPCLLPVTMQDYTPPLPPRPSVIVCRGSVMFPRHRWGILT